MNKDLLKYAYIAVRVAIGIAFLYAGILKLTDVKSFAETIKAFGLLPEIMIYPSSVILPLAEIICGAAMAAGNTESFHIISILLLLFVFVLVYGISKGIDVDCGCYGPDDNVGDSLSSLRTSLIRDLIMIFGIIYIYVYRSFISKDLLKS